MTGLGPRVLQVLQFANARAPELQSLHELSQHNTVSSVTDMKLETQKRQRRRRANAFKSHKLPQRLRAASSNNQSALRCRKHQRRPHKLLQERSDGTEVERPRWLSTHVWHAKRMVMRERYGYMLAIHRSDKSVSAALQAMRKMATVHDCSYYGIIELFGLPHVILEVLQLVSDPNGSDFHRQKFLAGADEGTSMVYHHGQFPQGAIAPVTFMWRPLKNDYKSTAFQLHEQWPSTKRQLWLWVPPGAYMEVATAIAAACQEVGTEGLELHDRRGHLCRLKVRGRLANDLVATLARDNVKADDIEADEAVSDHDDGYDEKEIVSSCCSVNRRTLLRVLSNTHDAKETDEQPNGIYAVVVKDPRLARYQAEKWSQLSNCMASEVSLLSEPPTEAVPKIGTSVIKSPLSGLSLSSLGKDAEEPETKVLLKEMQELLAWTTNTLKNTDTCRYPIARANKEVLTDVVIKEDSMRQVSPSSLLWSLSKRQKLAKTFLHDHTVNEAIYRQRRDGHAFDNVCVESSTPLHLLAIRKRESYPHTSGWDLICPPSCAPRLLKALVFRGAFVVGLREDAAQSTVGHQPSFPRDFPDTHAGQGFWDTCAQDLEMKRAKRPKAKQFNYEKHGVKAPYQPRWEILFAEKDNAHAPCVLRGRKYMNPFCFYRSTSNAREDSIGVPSFDLTAESVVAVPMPTLVRVVVVIPRRGNVETNAMLLAPSLEDVNQFCNDQKWMGYDLLLGKNSKSKDHSPIERSHIGYVTSAIYDRPKSAFRAMGFIACEPLQHLFIMGQQYKCGKQGHFALAMLRSPQGRMVRPVLVQAEP